MNENEWREWIFEKFDTLADIDNEQNEILKKALDRIIALEVQVGQLQEKERENRKLINELVMYHTQRA